MRKIPLNISPEVDIVELFSHFAAKPWSFLLDSANADHVNSRFDIFVADPQITLETRAADTVVTNSDTRFTSNDDPLTLLQQQLDSFSFASTSDDIPFTGGALGYWGYDLGRRFESIPTVAENDINLPDMAVGIYLWCVVKDNRNGSFWLIDHTPQADKRQAKLEQLLTVSEPENCDFKVTQDWSSNMTKDDYRGKFAQVKQHLIDGNSYQINLAQRFSAEYSGSEWQAYRKLRAHNKAPFSAFLNLPDSAVLSISPERFLQLTNGLIETKPIKGTRPRSENDAVDIEQKQALANSSKDRAENLMIVDLLRNDIGRVAEIGSVEVPTLFAIESFPSVHHLVSTITAKLDKSQRVTDLLRACFPGGSITGAPKISAMKIIESLEPHRRSVYCGSIGYIDFNGNMDSNIAIRTLICENNKIHCWAGGGLVYDSTWDSEYQETYDKVSKILPVLSQNE